MNSREIIRLLEDDGWRLNRLKGSHHQYVHDTKPGTVTIPHPRKDFPKGTIRSIEKQSGVGLR
ncbi:MAG: type II toxin-antitoxin system HicA family toxin [Gemmatimonadaceae bacterium]